VAKLTFAAPSISKYACSQDKLNHCRLVWAFHTAEDFERCEIFWHKFAPVNVARASDMVVKYRIVLTKSRRYKGPAPLHWTILNGEKKTGMSLQTLHPSSFDEGVILDQSPWPGIDIPEDCTYHQLLEIMQPLGAEMLVKAIRDRLYLPPHNNIRGIENTDHGNARYKHAPKIDTAHRLLHFQTMDSSQILRMSRAFGSTWAYAAVPTQLFGFKQYRLIFSTPFTILPQSTAGVQNSRSVPEVQPGLPYWSIEGNNDGRQLISGPLLVNTVDGKTLSVATVKVEGDVDMPAYKAAVKHKLTGQPRCMLSRMVIPFHEVLSAQP
jgi:methionyl-tRNA formyltransferase